MQYTIFENIKVEAARNQLASVLKMLLENESVSEQDMRINAFRSRISDLRLKHSLDVGFKETKFKNQFGRESSYRKHFLVDKEKGVQVYKEINK